MEALAIPLNYEDARVYLLSLSMTQPRILAMFMVLPLFNSQIVPGLVRFAISGALGLVAMPVVAGQMAVMDSTSPAFWMLMILKEVFVGFVMGFIVAIPFWIFEAVGFLIDNQRGASISATLNPLTGNDSSPLGILFNQAFIVFFMVSGGFALMLGMLYDSFQMWSVTGWIPHFRAESAVLLLDQLNRLVRMAMLLAAPAIVAMFLAELGLALVSRFAPQLQVFFVAMPVKSGLSILILVLYAATLFEYGAELVESVGGIMPFLTEQWSPEVAR
ncbi:type III secretion system export apparatus subunit SctT [Ottowia thiooxydans]|uniref:Type III secretion protein T n=1 Tax=Ottowia thiooxydans TaxID=219182 RepID=A0ABV2QGF6_9BURK